MTPPITLLWREPKNNRQVLEAFADGVAVGHLQLGIKNAEDEDSPVVNLDYILADSSYRNGVVSRPLMEAVHRRWPDAKVVAGPLSDDDEDGPGFRARCWDAWQVPIHDPGCEGTRCSCRSRIERFLQARSRDAVDG